MRIDISEMPVGEFVMFAYFLEYTGWWIKVSAEKEKVWAEMDKPIIMV